VKIRAEAAPAAINYDFGQAMITKARIVSLESFAHYFLKGYAQPPGAKSVPDPHENEEVVFKDFFAAGLRMPPHPAYLDILHRSRVQLHQLMPNATIQISKFILTRIGTRGTTPHGLERPKEGSATTRPTIQKIQDDHGMLPKA
jgi:hypothetical protein